MRIGEVVDKGMQRVSSLDVILDSYSHVSSFKDIALTNDLRAALMKSAYECEVNKGSGRSRKNCFSKPATLFTSW